MKKKPEASIKEYGMYEHVPKEGRHYSFIDMLSTWFGVNCCVTTWYMGGCIAAMGLAAAFATTTLAGLGLFIVLALVGYIGYKFTSTPMGTLRVSFGIRGSKLPTVINTISMVGWVAITNYMGAISMTYVFNAAWGTPCYGMEGAEVYLIVGALINGALSALLVRIGGSRSVKIGENVSIIAMIIFCIWIVIAVFKDTSMTQILAWKPDEGTKISTGVGIDLVLAFAFSWLANATDYTRYCKTAASATIAPVIGSVLGLCGFAMIGAIGVITSSISTGVFDPYMNDPSYVATTLGLGLPAMFVILLSTVTTNMVAIYSGTYSAMNLVKETFPVKKMMDIFGAVTVVLGVVPIFFASFLDTFYVLLDYMALIYPPMIAIMLTDYYLLRRSKYQITQLNNPNGPYWYHRGFNLYGVAAWLLSIVLFLVFKMSGLVTSTVGAIIPAFVCAAIVYYIAGKIGIKNGAYEDLCVEKTAGTAGETVNG